MMIYEDFKTPDNWPGDKWVRFTIPGREEVWDPSTAVNCPGGADPLLVLTVPAFTIPNTNHIKALMLSTASFDVPEDGMVTASVEMGVTTFGTDPNPFGVAPGDPRLVSGNFVVIDLDTAVILCFAVSNDRIVPVYERPPLAREKHGDYPAFTSFMADQGVATLPGQHHDYDIRYDRARDYAEWCVDGVTIATQNNIGAPPGMAGPIVKLDSLKLAGGMFTSLDDLPNDRLRAGDNPPLPGLSKPGDSDLFGQGARLSFKNFRVE